MTWRRRLRRRLLWAGVLLGLVLLLVAVSALRVCAWGRDLLTDNASRTRRALERREGTMTRTLTLVVGIALAALAIAPMALGKGRLAPLSPPSQVATYRDAGDAARPSLLHLASAAGWLQFFTARDGLASNSDSGPHRVTTATLPLVANPTYTTSPGKSAPAKLAATRARAMQSASAQGRYGAGARGTEGRHIDWPQIGIGIAIGIGMALAIGLALSEQAKRARPLPH